MDIPPELRAVVESGPLVHLTTLNADGSPQVTVVWAGFDDGDLVTAHLPRHLKIRNMERDPRVVLSFDAPRVPGAFLNDSAVLKATAEVEPTDQAWDLLDRLAKVYIGPEATFPVERRPGYIVRYKIQRIGGVGPWTG